jgi:hypothetical protein
MIARLNPRDPLELCLVQQMIAAQWKLDRLHAAEQDLMQSRAASMDAESRGTLLRIVNSRRNEVTSATSSLSARDTPENRLALEKYSNDLERCEKDLEAWRPVSSGKVLAELMKSKNPALERLQRYMQKLELSFQRALRQLRELQKAPNDADVSEFAQALLDDDEQRDDESDETKPPQAQESAGPDVARSPAQIVIPSGTPRGFSEPRNVLEFRDPSTSTSREDTQAELEQLNPGQGRASNSTGGG